MKIIFLHFLLALMVVFSDKYAFVPPEDTGECTIGVFTGAATADGRPLLWKNRDVTNDVQKFCYFEPRLPHAETTFYCYIGNVYSADTTRVYMGLNEVGFAIINANCYNLPDSLNRGIDDGELIRMALERCRTVADFEDFMEYTAVKGRKDCWNIGVIDGRGGAAMYECSNYTYIKYDANDPEVAPEGIIIRTTFAFSGGGNRISMNRYKRAYALACEPLNEERIDARYILQKMSRDLFNYLEDPYPLPYTGQQNGRPPGFILSEEVTINRNITRSVMVIRGVAPDEDPRLGTVFCTIGPPVISVAYPLWVLSRTVPIQLNFGEEVPMFSRMLQHRQMLYPLGKDPLYLDSGYLKNANGMGLFDYILPLEDVAIDFADSCVASWKDSIPNSAEMRGAQQAIAANIYFNYSQIPVGTAGINQPEEYYTADISCYPNPFNARMIIYLSGFGDQSTFSIGIYDVLGRKVEEFTNINGPENTIAWDGRDYNGNQLSSGVYFVRAETGSFAKTVKILLIK
jgi:hypothetical protein